jgi:octaprenyl-diphosphate synthase
MGGDAVENAFGRVRGLLLDGVCDDGVVSWLERIEGALGGALPKEPQAAWLDGAFGAGVGAGAGALLGPCADVLGRGGKRWRPLLACLVCEALGGGEGALPLAPLVELCHNASLIHDDIEDGSTLRRGLPAAHVLYGVDAALNAGCFLYFLPLMRIDGLEASAEFKLSVYSLWALTMRRLHLGQSLDIDWHRGGAAPSVEEYYAMCALKTGSLARFAVELGARAVELGGCAAADGDLVEGLALRAERLGVGFQVLDDVRNLICGVPGKERGDDVVEGKMSLPVLLFLRSGGAERREFVGRCFAAARVGGVGVPEVGLLIEALQGSGALEEAEREARGLLSFEAAYGAAP